MTLNPAEGYTGLNFRVVKEESYDVVESQTEDGKTYTFVMPAADVVVAVDFCLPGTTLDTIYYKGPWTNVKFEFCVSTGYKEEDAVGTMVEDGIYSASPGSEWSYSLIICDLDIPAQRIDCGAIPTDGRNMYNAETQQWETYTPSQPPEDTISADISWGSLSFTYTDGENGAEGTWSCEDGANEITVTNTGDNPFNVQPIYTAKDGYTEINGIFYESMEATTNTMFADLYSGESFTFYLKLFNKPSKALDGDTIATVTIRIAEGIGQ